MPKNELINLTPINKKRHKSTFLKVFALIFRQTNLPSLMPMIANSEQNIAIGIISTRKTPVK